MFGIYHRDSGLSILKDVKLRTKEILHPIIKNYIKSGSIIFSDNFATYCTPTGNSHLEYMGYHHMWTNHTESLVHERLPFLHSLNIEYTWKRIKEQYPYIHRFNSK